MLLVLSALPTVQLILMVCTRRDGTMAFLLSFPNCLYARNTSYVRFKFWRVDGNSGILKDLAAGYWVVELAQRFRSGFDCLVMAGKRQSEV